MGNTQATPQEQKLSDKTTTETTEKEVVEEDDVAIGMKKLLQLQTKSNDLTMQIASKQREIQTYLASDTDKDTTSPAP